MIYSSNFIAVLDACVLYPAPVRDLLLSLADVGLYKPKWTAEIQEEWSRNLLLNRADLKKEQLEATMHAMNMAFPDANVERYEGLISGITLPDPHDRHVMAASIRARADVIVTFNLKDFPKSIAVNYDIEILHPDVFLTNLHDLHPAKAKEAFNKMVKRLKNPPKPAAEVLVTLKGCGLTEMVERLRGSH